MAEPFTVDPKGWALVSGAVSVIPVPRSPAVAPNACAMVSGAVNVTPVPRA